MKSTGLLFDLNIGVRVALGDEWEGQGGHSRFVLVVQYATM